MTRRHACLLLLLLASSSPLFAEEESPFNTVRVKGRNYVNLADIIRFYGFTQKTQRDLNIHLKSKSRTLRLTINHAECRINGVSIWLNEAPMEYRSSILISEVDVRKTLDPVLRPWKIPKRKVKTILLDPGHGEQDPGTQGYRGTKEKHMTLDLSARVAKRLRAAGFETLLTRRDDTYISLEDRVEQANSSDADLFVSIHFNALASRTPAGIETYCLTPAGLSSTNKIGKRLGLGDFGEEAGNRFDAQNMLLAYLVQQRLLRRIPKAEDRGVRRARFKVIKDNERPSILIENGFLSNPTEEKRILSPAYRDVLATAIAEAIQSYAKFMNRDSD